MDSEIVTVDWLHNNLDRDDLVLLDASPSHTASGMTSHSEDCHIPRTRVVDIKKDFTDSDASLPNTFPTVSQFEEKCQDLGISKTSEVLVYDNLGIYTSPRVWWMFKAMGYSKVKVLDGGLVEWSRKGYRTVSKADLEPVHERGDFICRYDSSRVVTYEDVVDNISSEQFILVDARSQGRYEGSEPEPRKHLKSGKVPGSINIPYTSVLEQGKFKSKEELRRIFEHQIADETKLVFSCGSGMTACIVLLASDIAFRKSRYVYDGSWTEYADRCNLKLH